MVYKYLIADIILFFIWIIFVIKYKKLRKEIFFGSVLYAILLPPLFMTTWALNHIFDITWRYIPDYYNPDTLFNLGRILGGLSIEDVLFMIFAGGIISVIYEILFKKRPVKATKKKHQYHILSLVAFVVSYISICFIFKFNPIYNLIISGLIGFIIIAIQRRDLIEHALYGALSFSILYIILGIGFIWIFPDSLYTFWNLRNLSGITIFGFPIEELLYAFSFGLMWAPMYEYVKGLKT